MNHIRIVVADQADAVFYDLTSLKARPLEVARLTDAAAGHPLHAQFAAHAGRSDEGADARRPAAADEPELRRQQALCFAHKVAERLEADRRECAFQQLIVVAGAPFRSFLRAELSAATKGCIVYEVPQDLVHSHIEALLDYLPDCAQELKSA